VCVCVCVCVCVSVLWLSVSVTDRRNERAKVGERPAFKEWQ
jgi:hypothetical protein